MPQMFRALVSFAVVVATGVVLAPGAGASPTDARCSYSKQSKLVTLTLPSLDPSEGDFLLSRVPGTKRIGYATSQIDWQYCGASSITNTNRVKVVGTQQSETLIVSLQGGAFAPGASPERTGRSEIEITGDLGDGTDTVLLQGGDGRDELGVASRSSATLNSDDDADVSLTGVDEWEINGGPGNDRLSGAGANGIDIRGAEGDDRVNGSPGDDRLYGDAGATLSIGNDVVNGSDGDDALYGGEGNDVMNGGNGDDWLNGEDGKDSMNGGNDDDGFWANSDRDGSDTLTGGEGDDNANYSSRTANVRVSLDRTRNDGERNERDLVAGDVETVYGGSGNDVLKGNGLSNYLSGNTGNDQLFGEGEDDSLRGGDGNDALFGGSGDEYLPNDVGSDRFFGQAGDDALIAGSSNDGRDVFSGGDGRDSIDYGSRSANVVIDVRDQGSDGEVGENDYVYPDFERVSAGSGSDTIYAGPLSQIIYGNAGNDSIDAGRGADTVYGSSGTDSIIGGEGLDELYGGDDADTLDLVDLARDDADCGNSADTVTVDPGYDLISNCETVLV